MRDISPKFDRDKFFVNQRRFSLKERYYVYDEQGTELFYVERPFGLFRRRNITLFADDSKREPLLHVNQDHYWEIFHRNYTVVDADGEVIAKLSRNNFTSLFRRGWHIMEPGGATMARARENSLLLSALRRIVDFIPYADLVGGIFRTNFDFLVQDGAGNDRKLGSFNRRFTIGDKYVLDLSEDRERRLDRKVALAVGILLDTAEKR